jgi:hypothetical protein
VPDELETLDLEGLSDEQIHHALWRAGSIRHLMSEVQKRAYDAYRAWEAMPVKLGAVGSFPRVFVLEWGKRIGKTTLCLWAKAEDAIRNPGSKCRYTSAFDNSISAIINDVQRNVFATCPEDVRPKYFGKRGPRGPGFYFPEWGPAAGSVIYLEGLESNPDALRGQECELGDVISECAFIPNLIYTVRNVLYQQYQGKPRARMLLESSAPVDLDTDWELVFLPDAKQRSAVHSATIEDNDRMSREEKDEFISAAYGRGHPDCEREYFNVINADPHKNVVPEFKPDEHVKRHKRPEFAITVVGADPGLRDLFGMVWGYWDFLEAKLVIQASWAKGNAGTRKVAAVNAAMEFALWGSWPSARLKNIPLKGNGKDLGWCELLDGEPNAVLAEKLFVMSRTPEDARPWFYPPRAAIEPEVGHFCAWDGSRYQQAPQYRVSDIELRLIRDLDSEYGMSFTPTTKEALEVMTNLVRDWVAAGRIVFEPNAGPVIDHVRVARWNKKRTEWDRHPVYGHFDCLAALIYAVRKVQTAVRHLNPNPPPSLRAGPGVTVIDGLPWQNSTVSGSHVGLNSLIHGDTSRARGRVRVGRRRT